jgi:hypothetical protein
MCFSVVFGKAMVAERKDALHPESVGFPEKQKRRDPL